MKRYEARDRKKRNTERHARLQRAIALEELALADSEAATRDSARGPAGDMLVASARLSDVSSACAGHRAYESAPEAVRIAVLRDVRCSVVTPLAEGLHTSESERFAGMRAVCARFDETAAALTVAGRGGDLRAIATDALREHVRVRAARWHALQRLGPAVAAAAVAAEPVHAAAAPAPAPLPVAHLAGGLVGIQARPAAADGGNRDRQVAAPAAGVAPEEVAAAEQAFRVQLLLAQYAQLAAQHVQAVSEAQHIPAPVAAFQKRLQTQLTDERVWVAFSEWHDPLLRKHAPWLFEPHPPDQGAQGQGHNHHGRDHLEHQYHALHHQELPRDHLRDTRPGDSRLPPAETGLLTSLQQQVLFLHHALRLERAACGGAAERLAAQRDKLLAEQAAAEAAFARALRRGISSGTIPEGTPWQHFRFTHLGNPGCGRLLRERPDSDPAAGAVPDSGEIAVADAAMTTSGAAGAPADAVTPLCCSSCVSSGQVRQHLEKLHLQALADRLADFDFGPTVEDVYGQVVTAPVARALHACGLPEARKSAAAELRDRERVAFIDQYTFLAACRIGDAALVDELLSDEFVDPVAADNLALKLAAAHGHATVYNRLALDSRVNAHESQADTVRLAAKGGHCELLRQLLHAASPLGPVDASLACSAFNAAAEDGELHAVALLLSNELWTPSAAEVNAAVATAVDRGQTLVAERLLQDLRASPSHGDSYALRAAAKRGCTRLVKWLLADGRADPAAAGHQALRDAAANGHTAVVTTLLADARVDATAHGNAALRQACSNGHLGVVELLLANPRVDPRIGPVGAAPALEAAAGAGHLPVVERLLADPRVDPSAQENAATVAAANHDRKAVVRLLLDTDQIMDSCCAPPHAEAFASLWRALVTHRQSLPLCMLTRALNNPLHGEHAFALRGRLQVSRVAEAAWRRRWAAVRARAAVFESPQATASAAEHTTGS